MNAAEHYERYLGEMQRGWSADSLPGIQACIFRDQPAEGVVSLGTLGLSDTVLSMGDGRNVRQELVLSAYVEVAPEELARVLMHVSEEILDRKRALLRGEVISLGGSVSARSEACALYASIPVVFPEGLATLEDTDPNTVFVWLLPLLQSEVEFVRSSGWSNFEDALEEADADLFDLGRSAVV